MSRMRWILVAIAGLAASSCGAAPPNPSEADVEDETNAVESNAWPLPKFYFSVELNGEKTSFQEVYGLPQVAAHVTEGTSGTVTLRKGVFTNDIKLWDWFMEIQLGTAQPRTVVINLLDEAGTARWTWTLPNARPTKITGTELKSNGNEVAVSAVYIVYQAK